MQELRRTVQEQRPLPEDDRDEREDDIPRLGPYCHPRKRAVESVRAHIHLRAQPHMRPLARAWIRGVKKSGRRADSRPQGQVNAREPDRRVPEDLVVRVQRLTIDRPAGEGAKGEREGGI